MSCKLPLLRLAIKLGSDELEGKFAALCALAKLALSASAGGVEEPDNIGRIRSCEAFMRSQNEAATLAYINHLRASLGAAQGEIARLKGRDIKLDELCSQLNMRGSALIEKGDSPLKAIGEHYIGIADELKEIL